MSDSPPKTMRDLAPPLLTPPPPALPIEQRLQAIDDGPEPTLRDVMKGLVRVQETADSLTRGLNALASEVRGAVGAIGEAYGDRITELEVNVREINDARLVKANGTTPYAG